MTCRFNNSGPRGIRQPLSYCGPKLQFECGHRCHRSQDNGKIVDLTGYSGEGLRLFWSSPAVTMRHQSPSSPVISITRRLTASIRPAHCPVRSPQLTLRRRSKNSENSSCGRARSNRLAECRCRIPFCSVFDMCRHTGRYHCQTRRRLTRAMT